MVMSAGGRNNRRRSGLTNPYHISSILGTTTWWFWFGHPVAYQSLPHRTCIPIGDFGLVAGPFTNRYHAPDLGAHLPCCTFTKHYHRDGGPGIELSIVASRHGHAWPAASTKWLGGTGLCRVRMVRHSGEHSGRVRTVVVGVAKKIFFQSGRSASIFIPMVVKLVGQ